ncbi:MAG: DAK2 domain-containing protein, partial [Oscillospiraceae bacterium]
MYTVINSGEIIHSEEQTSSEKGKVTLSEDIGDVITFTYCTEFIINKNKAADPLSLRAYLESIGDSVVVVDDDDIIKCHVHTDNPGNALQAALKLGSLSNIKIDNMREQYGTQNIGE